MLADRFTQLFREEHRRIRDVLLDLIQAFAKRSRNDIGTLLKRTAELTGPHFRYEEESMYPALVDIFGAKYVETLLGAHDRAIAVAKSLVALVQKETLSGKETSQAVEWVREVLPHVSDCDGLSIMVERLPEPKVQAILDARERCNKAAVSLLDWAESIRKRPAVAVS